MKIATLATAIDLITAIAGGTVAALDRFASKAELEATATDIGAQIAGNTLLILYTQLDRAQAEARRLQAAGQTPPQSLLETIDRLCRQIRSLGGSC